MAARRYGPPSFEERIADHIGRGWQAPLMFEEADLVGSACRVVETETEAEEMRKQLRSMGRKLGIRGMRTDAQHVSKGYIVVWLYDYERVAHQEGVTATPLAVQVLINALYDLRKMDETYQRETEQRLRAELEAALPEQ